MLTNELIFLLYILTIGTSLLVALRLGKEALISIICIQCILVNLFVTKEITLFGLSATASDALAVGITLGLNLLQEYYKRNIALKTIWISFAGTIFYLLVSILHLLYKPVTADNISKCFEALLTPMPRIILASLLVYLIVQNIDCRLYGYLCKRFEYKHFLLRNYSSVAITQLIDTVLFSFLGLYRINQNYSSLITIGEIIIVSYTIKLIVIFITGFYLALSKKILKL